MVGMVLPRAGTLEQDTTNFHSHQAHAHKIESHGEEVLQDSIKAKTANALPTVKPNSGKKSPQKQEFPGHHIGGLSTITI